MTVQLESILAPLFLFAGLGLLAGLLLTIFSKIFAVKTDERLEEIVSALPNLNCGACGYSGCSNYAEHILKDHAPTNRCVPGGDKVSKELGKILGTGFEDVQEKTAFVACRGKAASHLANHFSYQGEGTCAAANLFYQGDVVCNYGCIGYGDCVKQCRYDAIAITDGISSVDPTKCTGCGMCAKACPRHIIGIRPANKEVFVACSSHKDAKETLKVCKDGCIGCGMCQKTCENDAIHVKDHLAVIDYDKCISCQKCVGICPRHCIAAVKV